ncbi:MAG TPA: ribosomal protein S18-alanine N-acetyltransferase [Xanthobacteraceae bacterium]|jgi:ribosomal-protein-alanine N-acetyltransferase|nr:ribosomal protein S18-alanine N-acetyltransferase [Xanthobacteraceae bacterium]
MIGLITRLLARPEPVLAEAGIRDAAALSALHAAAFRRGWSEDEFERLLLETNVVAHRAMIGRTLAGFIVSRLAAGEAEILSVAVAPARRGRGLARKLLDLHLRRLAGLGATAIFLEVDEDNTAARRLYGRAGFRDVGRRPAYYGRGPEKPSNALVLRRDLA